MARMDWVPQVDYGVTYTLTGGVAGDTQTAALNLLNLEQVSDIEGRVEEYSDVFVHRIVGEVYYDATGGGASVPLFWGIMPMQFDHTTGVPVVPWGGEPFSADYIENVNLRHWSLNVLEPGVAAFNNRNGDQIGEKSPWYHHVDLKPKQKCRDSIVPALWFSMTGTTAVVRFTSYLRLLCSSR